MTPPVLRGVQVRGLVVPWLAWARVTANINPKRHAIELGGAQRVVHDKGNTAAIHQAI
jgi:hypothetical protein